MTASVDQVRPREYERRQLPIFPNYTQVPRRVSVSRWRWIRLSVFVAGLIEIGLLVSGQPVGLKLFFGAVVPVLPLLWFVAPGVWRNLCPLAAANQTPRLFGFSRAKKAPPWLAEHGFLIAATTLLALIPARKFLLEESGPALGALLLVLLVLAFVGGIFFQGKSGWCSTVCPLLPVQRLYGQQPLLDSPNSHCEPCVGCAKNCNDFNPHLAFLADQHDGDRTWMLRRRLFAALFPGFIAGFFLVQSPPEISIAQMYGQILLAACLSAGVFFVLDAVLMVPPGTLTALSAAVSINLYYWWTSERALLMWGVDSELAAWTLRAVVLALSAAFLVRFVVKEKAYVETISAPQTSRSETTASGAVAAALRAAGSLEELVVIDRHGAETRVKTVSNKSVLDAVEGAGIQIESGCRMGVCGADPIAVLDGAESLSPPSADEKQTLRRLGLGPSARMACMSRVSGSCTISLNPELSAVEGDSTPEFVVDAEVRRVVVVGNGVAGVTAADYIRRFHPDCTIDLISREPHHLYNRMGISKLIYGRTAMEGLYLQPDRWYSDNKITTWLNTEAQRINPATRSVELGTGDVVGYDRLILATGSQSFVPPVPGFDRPGVFVCREAADATAIRRYAQGARARSAVVAGGGLLGIEAAYALYKLNVRVTVLERGPYLLGRQLDEPAARLLQTYLSNIGIDVLTSFSVAEVVGDAGAMRVVSEDGAQMEADLIIVAAGITPNVQLAVDAGLDAARGILVDERMRTSDEAIYAVGDCASVGGIVDGLWPSAVHQAEIAARNCLGDHAVYVREAPQTMLKVVGVDLVSLGRFPEDGDRVFVEEDGDHQRYRKLVVDQDGCAVGAISLGHPNDVPVLKQWIAERADVSGFLSRLEKADWSCLAEPTRSSQ